MPDTNPTSAATTDALTPDRPSIQTERLIQLHEKDACRHERDGRLGDAAFHSETADRLTALAARVIELEAENARLREALSPFARPVTTWIDWASGIAVTDVRRALDALEWPHD